MEKSSCLAFGARIYYRPIEAAIRWSGLLRFERRILATPSWLTRAWRATGKRLYVFVTRRLLGWRDREGAGDRQL